MMNIAWTAYAACAEIDPELFFPEVGGNNALAAKRICGTCEVFAECRAYIDHLETVGAILHSWPAGIFAGEAPRERTERRRREAAA